MEYSKRLISIGVKVGPAVNNSPTSRWSKDFFEGRIPYPSESSSS